MGQAGDGIYLIETPEDVAKLIVRDPANLAYVTQTTLSVDDTARIIEALRRRFPGIKGPKRDDICYATQNRQDALKRLAQICDLVLVVGSAISSNSNRLREVAAAQGVPAYLIDGPDNIRPQWLVGAKTIGVTAGASTPEELVVNVTARLKTFGAESVEIQPGEPEVVTFPLPRLLQPAIR